jgi:N-acetylneuraminate synthase
MTSHPVIVAEISGNHNGGLDKALELVRAAHDSDADFVKIQTYTPDSITLPINTGAFQIPSSHPLWGGRSLYDLYTEAHTPLAWHQPIFELAAELGIGCFSTPFDESAVEFLENFDPPMYKVASLEIVDLPLIREIAMTGKPIVISTGAANLGEIERALNAASSGDTSDVTLLVCTSSYPAPIGDSNLSRVPVLRDLFDVKVGFSDHTLGNVAAIAATVLGASMIEKHLTLSREVGGVDSAFSMEPHELLQLTRDTKLAKDAVGHPHIWNTENESISHNLRPSLYITKDVKRGEIVSDQNVRSVRPAGGLAPDSFEEIKGREFLQDFKMGEPTQFGMFGGSKRT